MRHLLHSAVIVIAPMLFLACSDDSVKPPLDSRAPDSARGDVGPAKPDSARTDGARSPDGAAPTGEWAALVRGTLFTTDLNAAKTTHDQVAKGGETGAKAAGNFAHDPMLSTTLLGGAENLFASIDRWSNAAGLAIYKDPTFKAGLGTLFKSEPTIETFERQKDWKEWGTLDAADTVSPHWVVVVRGTLGFADKAAAKAAHDQVAGGGEATVKAAGDVAHVVYLGSDWKEFFAVDVWKDATQLPAVYSNPDFQKAFASLFASPPTVVVYKTTDWASW